MLNALWRAIAPFLINPVYLLILSCLKGVGSEKR